MKKKRTKEEVIAAGRASVEKAAEETERLSSIKPDLVITAPDGRWHAPPPVKRPRKGWKPSPGLILYGLIAAMVGTATGVFFLIKAAVETVARYL